MGRREAGKIVENVSLHTVLPSHFKTFHLKYINLDQQGLKSAFVLTNPFFIVKKLSAER